VKLSRADESTKIYSNFLFACFFVALRKLEKKQGLDYYFLSNGVKREMQKITKQNITATFPAAALNKREFSSGNFFLSIFLSRLYFWY
jgi:hypothetical protein